MHRLTMAGFITPTLALSLAVALMASNAESCRRCSKARAFVEASCEATRYPRLCRESLSRYIYSSNQSRQQLAQIALTVSLARARYARAYVTNLASELKAAKGMEYEAVRDCIDQISDSVGQLSQSLRELCWITGAGGEDKFTWRRANVETWISAALTDQTTCLDGLRGAARTVGVRADVKGVVVNLVEASSNALA
ncbi:hypothetical protein Nepgr_024235 [Nepenthes gracilis]|uniref:Pectinesterase inhibitor domain-containing protein n=1 Tax=Nepenthes gracilis TaxID=150966 RepID=A0AAD3XYE7_NEPGR|nr:hypothetical protein Nepgr_024235 [Nepenthes gracilis]